MIINGCFLKNIRQSFMGNFTIDGSNWLTTPEPTDQPSSQKTAHHTLYSKEIKLEINTNSEGFSKP